MRTYRPPPAFLFRSCWTVSAKWSGFVFISWSWSMARRAHSPLAAVAEQENDAYLPTAPGDPFQELLDSQRKMQRLSVYQLELAHGEAREIGRAS